MQIMRNSYIRPLVISAVLLFSFGCRARILNVDYSQPGEPFYGDAIVAGSIGDASTLIPIVASDSASHEICGLVYNGLLEYDKDLNLIGDLADRWQIEDDGKTIIFYLRDDVRWHDGEPFTAYDVEFTYKKIIDPNVMTPYSGDFLKVSDFEVIDNYTVKIRYDEPFSPALSSWTMWIMPRHILRAEDLNTTTYGRSPIGTGPYRFKRWKSGERIDLLANRDYFKGAPYIGRYIYRIIPDNATIFLELQAEGVDTMGLAPLQYRRQTSNEFFKSHYNRFRYPAFGYTYLGYNLNDEKFKDKRVRRALNLAIDKGELIDGALMGLGRVCTGPFVPESWAYNKNIKIDSYDLNESKRLLKEAGWEDTDGDGWLDKNNEVFRFTIITNQGNDQRRRAAEIIQRRFKDIGIDVKIKIFEWSVFIAEVINKKRFETILLGWGLSRDPDCYDIWHSSKTKEGEFNFISYQNREVDNLLEKGRRIFDQAERARIYNKIHKILYDEQPYMFLWVADSLPIVHKRFKNIEVAPSGISYNFIKWYVPKKQQRYKL